MSNSLSSQMLPSFIGSQDVATVKASVERGADRDHVGSWVSRVFDRISDWFCGTNHAEVKQCLFDLFSTNSSAAEKFNSFEKLKSLVGDDYKDRFKLSELTPSKVNQDLVDTTNIDLEIDFGAGEIWRQTVTKNDIFFKRVEPKINNDAIAQEVMRVAIEGISEEQSRQCIKDIVRVAITINGNVANSESKFNEYAEEASLSSQEMDLIAKFCNQATEGMLIEYAVDGYHIVTQQGRAFREYDVVREDNGDLSVKITNKFNRSNDDKIDDFIEYAVGDLNFQREIHGDREQTSAKVGALNEAPDEVGSKLPRVKHSIFEGEFTCNLRFSPGSFKPKVDMRASLGEYVGPKAPPPILSATPAVESLPFFFEKA